MKKYLFFLTVLVLVSVSVYSLSLSDVGLGIADFFRDTFSRFFGAQTAGTCNCIYYENCDCDGDGNPDSCGNRGCNGVGSPCKYDSSGNCLPNCGPCDCSSCQGGGECNTGSQQECANVCSNNKYEVNGGKVSGHILSPDDNCWCSKDEYGVKCCECTCEGTWKNGASICDGGGGIIPAGCELESTQQCDCWTDSSCETKCRNTPAGSCPECNAYCVFRNNPCGYGKFASCPYAYGGIVCDNSLPDECNCPSIDEVIGSCSQFGSGWSQCAENDPRSCSDIPECGSSTYDVETLEGQGICDGCNNPVKYKRCCHKEKSESTTTTTSSTTTTTSSTTTTSTTTTTSSTTTTIYCSYLRINGLDDQIVYVNKGDVIKIETKVSDYGIIRYGGFLGNPRNLPRCSSSDNCKDLAVLDERGVTVYYEIQEDKEYVFYTFETNAYDSSECNYLCSPSGDLYKNNNPGYCNVGSSFTPVGSCVSNSCIKYISIGSTTTTSSTTTTTTTITTTSSTTTTLPGECPCYPGKSFYTGKYYYIFYYDCSDIVYKTSADGINWSGEKIAVEGSQLTKPPEYFDIYYRVWAIGSDGTGPGE